MISRTLKRIALAALPVMLVAILVATPAQADVLTVTNGEFTQYSNNNGSVPGINPFSGFYGPGSDQFQQVNPTGWVGGGGLIAITTANGTQQIGVNNPNAYLQVYGPTPGVTASPTNPIPNPLPGSNFVEADGNPQFEDSFSYTQLSTLTVGKPYQLSFFVAYGQQTGFTGDMTNQWVVALGKPGSSLLNNTTDTDSSASVTTTPLTSVASGHFSGWQQVTVTLTPDASNDVLTFLAWANNGSTINVPPIAFLDIGANGAVVNTSATPEPASLTLMVVGMFGFGAYRLRRRRSNSATV